MAEMHADMAASVKQSIAAQGPADAQVVELEQRLNDALKAGHPPLEISSLKDQLLGRYYPAMLERGSRLSRDQFQSDVFFEVYNLRIVALSEELGKPASPEAAIAHLLLCGIYHQRGEPEKVRQHLGTLRRMLEANDVGLGSLGGEVINRMTESVQAVSRPG